jgi:GntR family transcriptional repressor for pyruvate dehydrogenase complex
MRKSSKTSGQRQSSDRVAVVLRELTERIASGRIPAGGGLPSEGELARAFDVSRTVIREAMRGLRAQGLVEVSRGRTPRVKPPDAQAAVASLELLLRRNQATLLQLAEVRQPLESEIAALAAARANDVHLLQLQRALDDLATRPTIDERVEADVRFHRILAEATGNPVFVLLLETLAELLRESRRKTLAYSGVEYAAAGHRPILAAVAAHDPERARAAMDQHLQLAARDLHEMGG